MMSSSSNSGGPNKSGGGGDNHQTVKFARRTSSGRYVNLSREEMEESGDYSNDYMNYMVHMPPANQPTEGSTVAAKAEEQYVSNSLFTGGFNSVTRAHLMDKVIEGEGGFATSRLQGKGPNVCHMPVCDGKVMTNDAGDELLPCECRYIFVHEKSALIRNDLV